MSATLLVTSFGVTLGHQEVRCLSCSRLLGMLLEDGTLEVKARDCYVKLREGVVVCPRCDCEVEKR